MTKTALYHIILLCLIAQLLCGQEVINLYNGTPEGSEDWTWSEGVSEQNQWDTKLVYNVVEPTLEVYLPPYYLATGTSVIIAPGGGFHVLSIDSEGREVAKWLNSKGVAAFVLKYRVVHSETDDPVSEITKKKNAKADMIEVSPLAMADGLTAVRYVRTHAADFDIDPNKIGFMGFSAGGTVALNVAYNATEDNRPNFLAPIYPSNNALINPTVPTEKMPAFITAASNDQLQLMPHSIDVFEKWLTAGQEAELHVYEKGGHGFGMRIQNLPSDQWYKRFGEWLHTHGLLTKMYPNKYEKIYGQDAVAKGKENRIIQMQSDYALLERYRSANQSILSTESNPVVFLGNSITEAWANVDSSFFADNKFIGRGISGQTSAQLLLRFRQDVIELHPKAVVIHIGTNDIAENTGPYDPIYTMGNIQSMVDLARANDIKVLLASVLPATKFEWRRALGDRSDMIVDLNERIKAYTIEMSIPYIDYHSAMSNETNGMDVDIAEDGVHPTAKGFDIMKALALKAINEVLVD